MVSQFVITNVSSIAFNALSQFLILCFFFFFVWGIERKYNIVYTSYIVRDGLSQFVITQ